MWIDDLFSGSAGLFGFPAVLGTGFFLLRTVLSLAGAAGHDVDHHGDVGGVSDSHGGDHDVHLSDKGGLAHSGLMGVSWAEAFSLQSISAFATGFGWSGLIALHVVKLPLLAAMPVGLAGGLSLAYCVIRIFRAIRRLEADGTVRTDSLVGLEGDVYVGIPERGKGSGEIRVVSGSVARMMQAVSRDRAIPTGSRVLVLERQADNSLLVQAITPP